MATEIVLVNDTNKIIAIDSINVGVRPAGSVKLTQHASLQTIMNNNEIHSLLVRGLAHLVVNGVTEVNSLADVMPLLTGNEMASVGATGAAGVSGTSGTSGTTGGAVSPMVLTANSTTETPLTVNAINYQEVTPFIVNGNYYSFIPITKWGYSEEGAFYYNTAGITDYGGFYFGDYEMVQEWTTYESLGYAAGIDIASDWSPNRYESIVFVSDKQNAWMNYLYDWTTHAPYDVSIDGSTGDSTMYSHSRNLDLSTRVTLDTVTNVSIGLDARNGKIILTMPWYGPKMQYWEKANFTISNTGYTEYDGHTITALWDWDINKVTANLDFVGGTNSATLVPVAWSYNTNLEVIIDDVLMNDMVNGAQKSITTYGVPLSIYYEDGGNQDPNRKIFQINNRDINNNLVRLFNVNTNGISYFKAPNGAAGKVWTSDASGLGSWQAAASGATSPITLTANNASETPLTIKGVINQSAALTSYSVNNITTSYINSFGGFNYVKNTDFLTQISGSSDFAGRHLTAIGDVRGVNGEVYIESNFAIGDSDNPSLSNSANVSSGAWEVTLPAGMQVNNRTGFASAVSLAGRCSSLNILPNNISMIRNNSGFCKFFFSVPTRDIFLQGSSFGGTISGTGNTSYDDAHTIFTYNWDSWWTTTLPYDGDVSTAGSVTPDSTSIQSLVDLYCDTAQSTGMTIATTNCAAYLTISDGGDADPTRTILNIGNTRYGNSFKVGNFGVKVDCPMVLKPISELGAETPITIQGYLNQTVPLMSNVVNGTLKSYISQSGGFNYAQDRGFSRGIWSADYDGLAFLGLGDVRGARGNDYVESSCVIGDSERPSNATRAYVYNSVYEGSYTPAFDQEWKQLGADVQIGSTVNSVVINANNIATIRNDGSGNCIFTFSNNTLYTFAENSNIRCTISGTGNVNYDGISLWLKYDFTQNKWTSTHPYNGDVTDAGMVIPDRLTIRSNVDIMADGGAGITISGQSQPSYLMIDDKGDADPTRSLLMVNTQSNPILNVLSSGTVLRAPYAISTPLTISGAANQTAPLTVNKIDGTMQSYINTFGGFNYAQDTTFAYDTWAADYYGLAFCAIGDVNGVKGYDYVESSTIMCNSEASSLRSWGGVYSGAWPNALPTIFGQELGFGCLLETKACSNDLPLPENNIATIRNNGSGLCDITLEQNYLYRDMAYSNIYVTFSGTGDANYDGKSITIFYDWTRNVWTANMIYSSDITSQGKVTPSPGTTQIDAKCDINADTTDGVYVNIYSYALPTKMQINDGGNTDPSRTVFNINAAVGSDLLSVGNYGTKMKPPVAAGTALTITGRLDQTGPLVKFTDSSSNLLSYFDQYGGFNYYHDIQYADDQIGAPYEGMAQLVLGDVQLDKGFDYIECWTRLGDSLNNNMYSTFDYWLGSTAVVDPLDPAEKGMYVSVDTGLNKQYDLKTATISAITLDAITGTTCNFTLVGSPYKNLKGSTIMVTVSNTGVTEYDGQSIILTYDWTLQLWHSNLTYVSDVATGSVTPDTNITLFADIYEQLSTSQLCADFTMQSTNLPILFKIQDEGDSDPSRTIFLVRAGLAGQQLLNLFDIGNYGTRMNSPGITGTALTIKGYLNQTAPLVKFTDSTSTMQSYVSPGGGLIVTSDMDFMNTQWGGDFAGEVLAAIGDFSGAKGPDYIESVLVIGNDDASNQVFIDSYVNTSNLNYTGTDTTDKDGARCRTEWWTGQDLDWLTASISTIREHDDGNCVITFTNSNYYTFTGQEITIDVADTGVADYNVTGATMQYNYVINKWVTSIPYVSDVTSAGSVTITTPGTANVSSGIILGVDTGPKSAGLNITTYNNNAEIRISDGGDMAIGRDIISVTNVLGQKVFRVTPIGIDCCGRLNNVTVGMNAAINLSSIGDYNVSIGSGALNQGTDAYYNVAIGRDALGLSTASLHNVAIGDYSLGDVTTGGNNIGIGNSAGYALTTGTSNIFIGLNTTTTDNAASDSVAIGTDATITDSNQIVLGATGVSVYCGDVPGDGDLYAATVSCSPTISSGSGAPGTTPGKIGDIYVDTTNHKLYFADGTTNSGNWVIAN